MSLFTAGQIARVCHEANRAITVMTKDVPLQPNWDEAPEEMISSTIKGIEWRLANPLAPPSAQHEEWVRAKIADGWMLGVKKDAEKKTHPALIPYENLPEEVKVKDLVFGAIVLAMSDVLERP